MAKTFFLCLAPLLLCLPAAARAEQRVMAYSNPAGAAEVDDTARYYHGRYYPQLRLVRAEELKKEDDVALLVGAPEGFPAMQAALARFGVKTEGGTLNVGGAVYSRNTGMALRWREAGGDVELRTGAFWQAPWATFYISTTAAGAALSGAGEAGAAYFVSYPSYPQALILRRGKFKLTSGSYHLESSEELAADPCGDFQRRLRSSTSTYITYYYKAGSWAEATIAEFIPRTEGEMAELKAYFGIERMRPMSYYLYDSRAEKEACTGVYGNGHAMPNAGEPEVFAVHCSTLSATGKHEFVHLFAEEHWGRGPEKLLREGIAVEQDRGWSGKPLSYWGPELRRRKALATLKTLLTDNSYWRKNSSEAYAAAGHFADFLIRKFGKEKYRQAYPLKLNDATALRIFGLDLTALEKAWLEQIDDEEAAARPQFFGKSPDYDNPALYLAPGPQSGISMSAAALRAEIGVSSAANAEELVPAVYRWMTGFSAGAAGGALIGKTTADGLLRGRYLSGCHDWALLFSSVLRRLGYPALMADAAGIKWARGYDGSGGFAGHVFAEAYLEGRWMLIDANTGRYVRNYDPRNPVIPLRVGGETAGLYVMLKGVDPLSYGIAGSGDLNEKMKLFAARLPGLSLEYPAYTVTYSRVPGQDAVQAASDKSPGGR